MSRRGPVQFEKLLSFAAIVAAVVVAACTAESQAGIIVPEPVSFDVADLAASLSGDSASGGTASGDQTGAPLPVDEGDSTPTPLGLLKSTLPSGGSSSNGTSSTSTGGAGTSAIALVLTSAVQFGDEPTIGKTVEYRRVSLPDAPGNELLRPPQAG